VSLESQRRMRKKLIKDEKVHMKQHIKRRIKPFCHNWEEVPAFIYYQFICYEPQLFKAFTGLSREMRKGIIKFVNGQLEGVVKGFKETYSKKGLQVKGSCLQLTPITFNQKRGVRVSKVIRFRVLMEEDQRNVVLGYVEDKGNQRVKETLYSFDLYTHRDNRWLWLHKDECLVRIISSYFFSSMATQISELIQSL